MALIALFATVAVPGPVGSRAPNPAEPVAPDLFQRVEVSAAVRGSVMTIPPLDPDSRSAGALDQHSTLFEPATGTEPPQARVPVAQPTPEIESIAKNPWHKDRNISWYGPGFYGNRTACGKALTTTLVGVAHRTLPCGTKVTFKNPANSRSITVPVVDRGPYVSGRTWDLTGGACTKLGACRTGILLWRLASGS
jgi:rare lipoprotein A (peptidoglycan hydrolase)